MSTTPKSLSLQDLTSAVHSAVSKLKTKPPATAGPYLYINPGIICGIIYVGRLDGIPEAQQIASTIAKQVSAHTGVTVAPIVEEAAARAATDHPSKLLPPGHVILGYKPSPESLIHL
jgi:hypothetical protein